MKDAEGWIKFKTARSFFLEWCINATRAVLRLVWPSILLQPARGRVATATKPVAASRLSESEIHLFEPHSIMQNKYFNVIIVYKTWIGRPLLRPSGRYRRGHQNYITSIIINTHCYKYIQY